VANVKQAYADLVEFSAVRRSYDTALDVSRKTGGSRLNLVRHLVLSCFEGDFVAEFVQTQQGVSKGCHAFVAEGETDDRHGYRPKDMGKINQSY
jgi:hypothetical protein